MKTISSRFLKGAVAVLLAVLMVFGSTLTGFAAVIENAETKANVDYAETSAETIYLRYQANMPSGSYDGTTSKLMTQSSNNSNRYYCTISLSANTSYGFFIIWGKNYYKVNTTATSDNSVQLYDYGTSNFGNSNHRVTYTTGTAGNYIFTFDTSNKKIVVSPETQTIKLAYDVASGHDTWWDLNNKVDFTKHEGHTYTLDLNLNKEKYYMFSIVNNVYWRGTSELTTSAPASVYCYGSTNFGGSDHKVNFTPPAAGTYRFTWNHADKTISVAELTYNVKKSESGGTGTVTLGGKTLTTTNASIAPGSYALSITAPTGCNVSNVSVTGGTLTTAGSTGSSTYTGTVNVNKDTTVSVTYVPAGYSCTVTAGEGGTAKITVGGEEGTSATIAHGTEYTLTATAETGYRFVGWYNGETEISTTSPYTTTATAAINYTAKFVKTYKVNVNFTEGIESIKYNNVSYNESLNNIEVDAGSSITVSATPTSGYAFKNWTYADGTVASTDVSITITNIQSDITLTANAVPTYSASVNVQTNKYHGTFGGSVTINGKNEESIECLPNETVTFVATPKANYYFAGWYSDADFTHRIDDDDDVYEVTMGEKPVQVHALFVRDFYVQGDITGGQKVKLVYDVVTNTYSGTSTGYIGNNFTVKLKDDTNESAANVNVIGGEHVGATVSDSASGYTLDPDLANYNPYAEITYELTPDMNAQSAPDGTYTMNITLQEAKKVAVTVNNKYIGDYAVGTTLEYNVAEKDSNYSDDKYIYDLKSSVATDMMVNDSIISVKIPDKAIDVSYKLGQYYYVNVDDESGLTVTGNKKYKAGDNVSITFTPNTGCTLNGVSYTIGEDTYNYKSDENAPITVTFTMPEQNVDITVDASVKFKVTVQKVIYNPDTALYNGGKPQDGHFVVDDNDTIDADGYTSGTIKLNAGYATNATFAQNEYTFIGYFTEKVNNKYYTNPIGTKAILNYNVTEDMTIYAVYAKNMYLPNAVSNHWSRKPMKFDPSTNKYSEYIPGTSANFKLENLGKKNDGTNDDHWNTLDQPEKDEDKCSLGGVEITINDNNNEDNIKVVGDSNSAMTFYVDGDAGKIYGEATTNVTDNITVYLSSGRLDLADTRSHNVKPVSEFLDEHVTVFGSASYGEDVVYGDVKDEDVTKMINIRTTIEGEDFRNNFYVKAFILYHSDGYMETLPVSDKGNNVYETGFLLDSEDLDKSYYVVPVIWYTQAYADSQGEKIITVYFDKSDAPSSWGPFVSVYPYGTGGAKSDLMGAWPGQLMVPIGASDNITKYEAQFLVSDTYVPQAVTFNNYTNNTAPGSLKSQLGLDYVDYNLQTFDYAEPVYLYEEGYSTITFHIKNPEGSNRYIDNVSSTSGLNFDLLLNESNEPMSLTTNVLPNATMDDVDFYIVAGEKYYKDNTKYPYDEDYYGEWSISYKIFDSNKNLINSTPILSGSIYDGIGDTVDGDTTSVLVRELAELLKNREGYQGKSPEEIKAIIAESTVAISYNPHNTYDSGYKRYDGQWYGTPPNKEYTINVKVALQEGSDITPSDTNEEPYGKAYVSNSLASDDIVVGETASLSAFAGKDDEGNAYRFIGWYTLKDGNYTLADTIPTYNPPVSNSETYYAVFEKLAAGAVTFGLVKYYYKGEDTAVHSHDGISSLQILVYECNEDGELISDTPLETGRVHSFDSYVYPVLVQDNYYKIVIKSSPAPGSTFYAWYQEAATASGTVTYEEVLMDRLYEKEEPAEASFIYKATGKSDNVIIYSDVDTPGRETTLVYHYTDRFGNPATYTVKNVPFTEDEIWGYKGNGNKQYMPTYITKYTMINPDTAETTVCYGDDEREKAENDGYTDVYDEYNMILANAPTPNEANVYDSEIQWTITSTLCSMSSSITHLSANQNDKTYTINYSYNNTKGFESGVYNTLLDNVIVADPVDDKGKEFSYWEEVKTVNDVEVTQIISYVRQYNYRITENKTIRAVYEGDIAGTWTPTIDSVTKTRELSDNGDYIYTDYLITFANSEGKVLDDVKNAEGIRYGLTLTYNPQVAKENTTAGKIANSTFVEKDDIAEALKQVAIDGEHTSIMSSIYNTYCFELTGTDTTVFNRLDYYLRYNNNGKYDKYNFTAVAYIMYDVDGNKTIEADEVFLSNAEYVNFFTEANS